MNVTGSIEFMFLFHWCLLSSEQYIIFINDKSLPSNNKWKNKYYTGVDIWPKFRYQRRIIVRE